MSFCIFSHDLKINGSGFFQQINRLAELITIQLEENELPHCKTIYF